MQSELQYSRTQQKGCASCAASQQTALFGVFFNGSSLLQGRHHSGDQKQLHDNARHGIEQCARQECLGGKRLAAQAMAVSSAAYTPAAPF